MSKSGLQLLGGIITLLLAFLGLLALLDLILGWFGGYLNSWFGWHVDWSFKTFLGYIFYPLFSLIGVPPGDAAAMARIVGERTVATEVASFQHLASSWRKGTLRQPALGPDRLLRHLRVRSRRLARHLRRRRSGRWRRAATEDLSRLGFRALVAATLVGLMTAAVAGTFFTGSSVLMGGKGGFPFM